MAGPVCQARILVAQASRIHLTSASHCAITAHNVIRYYSSQMPDARVREFYVETYCDLLAGLVVTDFEGGDVDVDSPSQCSVCAAGLDRHSVPRGLKAVGDFVGQRWISGFVGPV